MTGRDKWRRFLAGEDVGPMVNPLCDKWCTGDIEYKWDGGGAEPFEPSEDQGQFMGQIMMGKTFGWDPLFYARIPFLPNDKSLIPVVETSAKGDRTQTLTTLKTPLGDLTRIDEQGVLTSRCIKEYLEDESDYEKMIWYTSQIKDFDKEAALDFGRRLRETAGEMGMLGTWVSPSAGSVGIQSLFYHLMDYPDAFERLRDVKMELKQLQLDVYREAGFDFMFFCVGGMDSISPGYYQEWLEEEVCETISWWKSTGGFTLWHGCGHVREYVELGLFNKAKPEMLETLSEPPVGNLPSLSWARERLDPGIITKGNIPLNILYEGTPEDVRAAVRHIKSETKNHRGIHVIGLSDNVLTGTPSANLHAYVDEGYRA